MAKEKNVAAFNKDVEDRAGYLYTRDECLSGRLASKRIADCLQSLYDFRGKRVWDSGCGDGTWTVDYLRFGAREVLGTDAAETAIKSAQSQFGHLPGLSFAVLDIYDSRPTQEPFDVLVLRGVLHHLYDVQAGIQAISQVAKTILVVEPNGYNPVLKVIEKTSSYHIAHEEKSFPPHMLDRWFEDVGGKVVARRYIGLVPTFCPESAARALKRIEPIVEAVPLVKQVGCAQYVIRIEMPS